MIWKIIAAFFVIISGVVTFIGLDDRYAKCDDTEKGFKGLEIKIVQSLESFQKSQDYRQYDMMYESLERDLKNCNRDEAMNPSNPSIAEECEEIKQEKRRIRQKKKALMGG